MMHQKVQEATIFRWNARGFNSRLAEFRLFFWKLCFPLIVICKPRLSTDLRLSGCESFSSARTIGTKRVTFAIQRNLTYVHHAVLHHPVQRTFAELLKAVSVSSPWQCDVSYEGHALDGKHFRATFPNCQPPHILTSIFSAQKPIWGSLRINARWRHQVNMAAFPVLFVMSDGSPTLLRRTTYSSCVRTAFVSGSLLSYYY